MILLLATAGFIKSGVKDKVCPCDGGIYYRQAQNITVELNITVDLKTSQQLSRAF